MHPSHQEIEYRNQKALCALENSQTHAE